MFDLDVFIIISHPHLIQRSQNLALMLGNGASIVPDACLRDRTRSFKCVVKYRYIKDKTSVVVGSLRSVLIFRRQQCRILGLYWSEANGYTP